jgi:hypothetical protein
MNNNQTLRILVDASGDIEHRGALPDHHLGRHTVAKAIEVAIENLQGEVNNVLQGVFSLLSRATLSKDNFTVDEIHFSVGIDASGKVSLLSIVSGAVGARSCIQFKIKRISDKDG